MSNKVNLFDLGATVLNFSAGMAEADAMSYAGAGAQISGEFEAMQHFFNAKQRMRAGRVESGNIMDQGQITAAQYRMAGETAFSNATAAMAKGGALPDTYMLSRMKSEANQDAAEIIYNSRMNASRAMSDARMDAIKMRSAGRVAQAEGRMQKSQARIRSRYQRMGTVASTLRDWKWTPNFNSGYRASGASGK